MRLRMPTVKRRESPPCSAAAFELVAPSSEPDRVRMPTLTLAIVSVVAMFDSVYQRNRDTIGNYIEVFLDVPYAERVRRDKATAKNVYSSPSYSEDIYDRPQAADLCLENFGRNDSALIAAQIVTLLQERMAETTRSSARLRGVSP